MVKKQNISDYEQELICNIRDIIKDQVKDLLYNNEILEILQQEINEQFENHYKERIEENKMKEEDRITIHVSIHGGKQHYGLEFNINQPLDFDKALNILKPFIAEIKEALC